MFIHIYIHTQMYICKCMDMYMIMIRVHIREYIFMHTHKHTPTHVTHTHTSTHTHTCVYACVCIYLYIPSKQSNYANSSGTIEKRRCQRRWNDQSMWEMLTRSKQSSSVNNQQTRFQENLSSPRITTCKS